MLEALQVSFLTPRAALVGLAAVLPVIAIALAARRQRRLRRVLGLRSPGWRTQLPAAVGACLALALLGAAAAQPVVRTSRDVLLRTDAEVYFVFDNSRSMLARPVPSAPSRFERAQSLAVELRNALGSIPVGVASLTDRPLVHVFPTGNAQLFEQAVRGALGIEKPPPARGGFVTATDFGTLGLLGTDNFFQTNSSRRLAIVLSDGESRPFDSADLGKDLREGGVRVLAVRLWDTTERIWDGAGRLEPYSPDAAATALLDRLPDLLGGTAFAERDVAATLREIEGFLGSGPTVVAGREPTGSKPLGAWVALTAALPLALVVTRRR